MHKVKFVFEHIGKDWRVWSSSEPDKIFVYPSLPRAIKTTWEKTLKPYPSNFTLVLEIEDANYNQG